MTYFLLALLITFTQGTKFVSYIGQAGPGWGNPGAAVNGAAYDWQNILSRITDSTLRTTLTGSSNPTAAELRAGIKAIYTANDIDICISAFGGANHPMGDGANAVTTGQS